MWHLLAGEYYVHEWYLNKITIFVRRFSIRSRFDHEKENSLSQFHDENEKKNMFHEEKLMQTVLWHV